MENKKILTISIAAYNVEEYLGECLQSFLIDEIKDDLEVLIINDASTDRTLEIAKSYESANPEIFRVIDKENGGHGSTVNCGMKEAKGKYFKTVDGDDWVDEQGFVALVNFLKKTDADVVSTDYYWVDHLTRKPMKKIETTFPGIMYQKEYQFSKVCDAIYINMHAMTIRTELLQKHDIHLDENCFYVDAEYVLYPVPYIKTVVFLENPVYMYRLGMQTQSMSIKSMQKRSDHHAKVLKHLIEFYDKYQYSMDVAMSDEEQVEYVARLSYLEKGIAKIETSQIKIYLSYSPKAYWREKIKTLDKYIKNQYPSIYRRTENKGVWMLRNSNYHLYVFASVAFHLQLKIKK